MTFPSTAATIAAAANAIANNQDLSTQSLFGPYPSSMQHHQQQQQASSGLTTSTSSTPSTSSSSVSRPIRSQRTPMKEITTLDDPTELEDFMQQGEEGCINDMKQFITQFSLRQTTVAMMTGVSQPYISKLLNGNHKELSLRCRKNIYSWYLNCRRHPEKLASFLQDPSTRLETNGDGELIPQRRERYVFRPILIKILETFFVETPFPDYNKRAEIASACNSALQMDKKGIYFYLFPRSSTSTVTDSNTFV
uniref:POU-specific atypical domain-containing protein n=1 Tax=Panagrolaimus superbus TaxID=310955 RepID=A0A914ZAA8_9BILA